MIYSGDLQCHAANSVSFNCLINDVYRGSSTHLKVVFIEVLHPIELEFGNVDFWGERKTGEPGEKPIGAENQQPTEPTRGHES